MGLWTAQTSFTRGELDPRLVGRTDLESFYKGAFELTNVLSIPQGGVEKRPGMGHSGDALGDGRMENFSFNVEQNYLLVFSALRMEIYKDDVLQTNINGSGNDHLVTTLTLSQIQQMDYIQSADTIIITHEDVEPQIIQRTSDTAWTIADVPLLNTPQFNFDDASSPTPTSEIQTVQFNGIEQGSTVKLSLEGITTEEFAYEGANSGMATAIEEQLQSLPNTASSGITVVHTSGTEFNALFTVTFADDSAKDWRLITGFMVLGTVTGDEIVNTARTQAGVSKSEDTWSSARGWPRTATFHEGRLWFGGSKSRPSTAWGSNVNQPFDFNIGRALDDQSIEATLATDQVNAINGIISNRTLQIFTSGAEFYVPASPITPENIAVKAQTNLGSKRLRPIVLEGTTIFMQRTGKALFQFQFIDAFQSNESRSVSILAPHLINDPVQMAVRKGAATSDANYLYLVGDDGKMTVFNSNAAEGVQAFTRWDNGGFIVSVSVVDDQVYTLTKRTINSVVVFHIERENLNLFMDSGVFDASFTGTVLTGLDHLEGETVELKVNGAVQLDKVVSSGQITVSDDSLTNAIVETGLKFRPRIETMPWNINLDNGPTAAQKKRIMRVAVHLFESNGVEVNGALLSDKTIGQDQFDAPTPQTGFKRIFGLGWSLEASVVITQATPMPFTILALDLEVKT